MTLDDVPSSKSPRRSVPKASGILHVELHGQANPIHDFNVAALCAELNETETHYPGTNLRLNYVPLRSVNFPTDQDV